mmetsp:Transcript_19400/g.27068  ORF Transcript_19400/g.27068 Transcript_19400/m.27068 type:complete len:267 (-) Transcript_19400:515-1315(-)|eukprot:CAMPEP_0184478204 /NCGR_PEP_ID=MMETSP0113_2-20130426/291_1 /TAXON_ID=91329 /ORGANISM="Norrisiella sphaerica, Strain BC52" /LENGTH=266 /DNA_ID=CAMNT_0026855905 /DNA_START=275 /DNA_END=1075 /DNA_ORIENTATION=-
MDLKARDSYASMMAEIGPASRLQQRLARQARRRNRQKSEGKRLRITVGHTDSGKPGRKGAYENWLASRRLLKDDNKVYSTDPRNMKGGNFHLAFVAEGPKEFSFSNRLVTPSLFKISVPRHFENPLKNGLVFVLDDFSEIGMLNNWDGCDRKRYDTYVTRRELMTTTDPTMLLEIDEQRAIYHKAVQSRLILDGLCGIVASYAADKTILQSPVAYFDMTERKEQTPTFKVDFPRAGKVIVVKMISADKKEGRPSKTIDVRHIAFYE